MRKGEEETKIGRRKGKGRERKRLRAKRWDQVGGAGYGCWESDFRARLVQRDVDGKSR